MIVAVIGGANMDVKAKAFAPLVAAVSNPGQLELRPGGVARNIAENLARLNVPVALLSRIGRDALGDAVFAATAKAGVEMAYTSRSHAATGSYLAVLDHQGELSVAVSAMAIINELTPAVLSEHAALLRQAAFVIADCNLPAITLRWLKTLTGRLIIEPVSVAKSAKLREIGFDGLYAITPNRIQAETLTGAVIRTPSDAMAAAARLEAQGVRHAVISLGAEGAATSSAHVPAVPSPAVADVTGAGDAATAGLILGFIEGREIAASMALGQAAAHLTVLSAETVSPQLSRQALYSLMAYPMVDP